MKQADTSRNEILSYTDDIILGFAKRLKSSKEPWHVLVEICEIASLVDENEIQEVISEKIDDFVKGVRFFPRHPMYRRSMEMRVSLMYKSIELIITNPKIIEALFDKYQMILPKNLFPMLEDARDREQAKDIEREANLFFTHNISKPINQVIKSAKDPWQIIKTILDRLESLDSEHWMWRKLMKAIFQSLTAEFVSENIFPNFRKRLKKDNQPWIFIKFLFYYCDRIPFIMESLTEYINSSKDPWKYLEILFSSKPYSKIKSEGLKKAIREAIPKIIPVIEEAENPQDIIRFLIKVDLSNREDENIIGLIRQLENEGKKFAKSLISQKGKS